MCLRRPIHNRPLFELTRRPAEREALRRLGEFREEVAADRRIRQVQASMLRTLRHPRRCACGVPESECTFPDCEPAFGQQLWRNLPPLISARRAVLALLLVALVSLVW